MHQALGAGIRQLMGHFLGTEQGIEQHRHRPQAQGGVVGHHQLGAVGEEHRQAFAGGQTQIFESLASPAAWSLVPVSGGPAEKDQGRGLGGLFRGLQQQPGQGGW